MSSNDQPFFAAGTSAGEASSPPYALGPAVLTFGVFGFFEASGTAGQGMAFLDGAYVNSGNGTAMSRSCCSSNAESRSAFSADGSSGTECDIKRLLDSWHDESHPRVVRYCNMELYNV